ncbi:MAG: rRNA pseudouridine synthase [Desulfobulbaceae bacterium]|nr:rRNA pseudouridine synthase [Desulfobulbaceae bacterium]
MIKPVRLQKFLAQSGVCSRRKAEEHIKAGRVAVDGQKVQEMGVTILPGQNRVTFDNKPVTLEEKLVYYMLNKPGGYVTTLSDPQGRPIVTSLLKGVNSRLFPVGRLDLDTEGALILTNDGNLAQRIQHPSYATNKSYEALVKGIPSKSKIDQLETGIMLEGKKTSPARVKILSEKGRNCLMKITIHEGRKRQVKKMFSQMGHHVLHLKRTAYGKLTLGSLTTGSYRLLKPVDLKKIFL